MKDVRERKEKKVYRNCSFSKMKLE